MLRVADMLSRALPEGTVVMAGESELGREITWAITLRARLPAFPKLHGGEVAFVAMQVVQRLEPPATLASIVDRLGEKGVSGIVVLGEVASRAKEAAERLGVPLLKLPQSFEGALGDVADEVNQLIRDRREEILRRGTEVQVRLRELAIAGRGRSALVRAVSDLTGRPAALADEAFEIEAQAWPSGQCDGATPPPLDQATLSGALMGRPLLASDPPVLRLPWENGKVRIVAPVVLEGGIEGYLTIWGESAAIGSAEEVTVGQGASACAVELARERAVAVAEARLRGDFLEELFTNESLDEETILARAKHLGYDLARPYAVVSFALDQMVGREPPGQRGPDYSRLVVRDLDGGRPGCIWRVQGGRLAVLVPLDGTGDLNQARTAIEIARVNSQARLNGRTLSAGLGRFHAGPMGLRRAFREAEQALTIAQLLFGGDRLADFRDLGVFRLLFPLQGSTELRSFFDETLGALVHYDQKNNTELVSTLETFFASRGNLQRTAEALFLHRNTLSYRLGRVEDLTGLDLDNAEDCFRLQLALKIGRIL